jgi:hypothetical protein
MLIDSAGVADHCSVVSRCRQAEGISALFRDLSGYMATNVPHRPQGRRFDIRLRGLPHRSLEHNAQHRSPALGDGQGADATKKISPVAWQHINLQGRYEFQKPPDPLNVDMIIRALTELSVNYQSLRDL